MGYVHLHADQLKGTESPFITTTGTQDKCAKLFEKEEDNQYSEVLLPIQLAAVALNRWSQHVFEEYPGRGSWPSSYQGAMQQVQSVLTGSFKALHTACESLLSEERMGPVSGMRTWICEK